MSSLVSDEISESHRLSSNSNNLLWAAAEKKIQLSSPEAKVLIQERLNSYISSHRLQHTKLYRNIEKIVPKCITYESLDEFLCAADISYREMLEIISADEANHGAVSWSNDVQLEMCRILDNLSPQQRERAYSIVYHFVSDDFKTLCSQPDPLIGRKICTALSYKYNDNNQCLKLFDSIGLRQRWKKNKADVSFSAVPLEIIPFIASNTGLSPHWMLMLNENRVVLAKHEDTELIMDWFCFLSDSLQSLLCKSFQTVYLSGGFEDGE